MENEKLHFRRVRLYQSEKVVNVGRATKDIQDVYLDRIPALRIGKKWFCQFWNDDFNVNDNIRSGRPSGIDNDLIRDLVIHGLLLKRLLTD